MTYTDFVLNQETDSRTNATVPSLDHTVRDEGDLAILRSAWANMPGIPKVVGTRTDGEDVGFLGLDIRTLLKGEESTGRHAFHSIVLQPGKGVPVHWIEDGHAIWFVLRGAVDALIGNEERRLVAAGFGYAPPGTPQGFTNRSDEPAELFVWHSPAGAERAFAAARDLCRADPSAGMGEVFAVLAPYGFRLGAGSVRPDAVPTNGPVERIERPVECFGDFEALREEWARLRPVPQLVEQPLDCRNIQVGGQETRVLLSPEASASHASTFMEVLRGGFGAPLHHQCSEDECFIVLEGPIKLTVGNLVLEGVGYGAFAYVPRYASHAFQSTKGMQGRMYSMNSPGGHDRGFELGSTESQESPGFSDKIEAHGFTFHEAA